MIAIRAMRLSTRRQLLSAVVACGLISATALTLHGEPPSAAVEQTAATERLTVDEARDQSRLLQTNYEATLHVIHRHYFDIDEKHTIPAKALEDVFEIVDEGTGRSTRWIAVSTPAMNVDNKPREGFETKAAERLRSGEKEFESVEEGVYHRAGSITLFASCLRCHESGLTKQITKRRVAAIVMSFPVRNENASE